MNTVFDPTHAPPRQRNVLLWVVLALAGVVLALVLASVAFVAWGTALFIEQAQAAMQQQPEVVEHIGTIQSLDLDKKATRLEAGTDVYVFDLVGDKGAGRLTVEVITVDSNTEALGHGELELSSGRVIELQGAAASPAP